MSLCISHKVSVQVQQIVKKANGMLAFIARGFEYKDRDVLLQLSGVLVRPNLENCVQFWCPCLRKGVFTIEVYQADPGMAYEKRLSQFGLCSWEFRRVRGDLIET